MAGKGQYTTADYLPFEEFQKLLNGLHRDKLYVWEAYCKVSYCTAFRISDVRTTLWKDILGRDELIKSEQKTTKKRLIKINKEIKEDILRMYEFVGRPDVDLSVICNPETLQPYTQQHINYKLKRFRFRYKIKIQHFSTHTFRKTFARHVFETNGSNMKTLSLIQQILKHTTPQITLAYMGFVQDDIDSIYNSLHF